MRCLLLVGADFFFCLFSVVFFFPKVNIVFCWSLYGAVDVCFFLFFRKKYGFFVEIGFSYLKNGLSFFTF